MTDGNAITTSATGKKETVKDPQAVLDYSFYWKDWLAEIGDSIATLTASVVNPPAVAIPMVIVSKSHFDGIVTVFVSGGTVGKKHALNCRITTTSTPTRTDERTLYVKIKDL